MVAAGGQLLDHLIQLTVCHDGLTAILVFGIDQVLHLDHQLIALGDCVLAFKPAAVQISKTSGLAGIAYWINGFYGLEGEDAVTKRDELVVKMKELIDAEYEDGRQTVMTDRELDEMIQQLAPGRYHIK